MPWEYIPGTRGINIDGNQVAGFIHSRCRITVATAPIRAVQYQDAELRCAWCGTGPTPGEETNTQQQDPALRLAEERCQCSGCKKRRRGGY